mgnify:CR=1 FL=1
MGRFNSVRAEYSAALLESDYPDTNYSFLQTSPSVLNQTYQYNQITQNTVNSGFNPKQPYQISIPQDNDINVVNVNDPKHPYKNLKIPNRCNLWGYQKPISG